MEWTHSLKQYVYYSKVFCLLAVSFLSPISQSSSSNTGLSWLTPAEQQWLQQNPNIILGVDPADKPIEFIENGQHKGIAADYRKLIEAQLNIRFQQADYPTWEAMLTGAKNQEVDVIILLTKSQQRQQFLLFGDLYLKYKTYIVTRQDFRSNLTETDLEHLTLVAVAGYSNTDWLQQRFPDKFITTVASNPIALRMVSMGLADAFIGTSFATTSYISNEKITNLKFNGHVDIPTNKMGFAVVKKDNPEYTQMLHGILNKAFARITDSQRQAIENKWFGVSEYSPPFWTFERIVKATIAALVVLIAGVILWNSQLRRLIIRHTQQLEIATAKAEQANQAKSGFLANMSHEIRTPLTGILGMCELMKNTQLSKLQKAYVESTINSANNLLTLINDILDFSKIEANKLELTIAPFAMTTLIDDLQTAAVTLTHQKPLTFSVDCAPSVPAFVEGDIFRIRQILLNFISNAIKFTPAGSIKLAIKADTPANAQQTTLCFSVSDTGIGINQDQLQRIFKSFEQASNNLPRIHGGTGLGLSICQQLANLMGAKINVESTLAEGSTFSLILPLKIAQEPKTTPALASKPTKAVAENPKKILVAEDNPTSQMVIKKLLKNRGHSVFVVDNGQQVIEQLAQQRYDIILMDIDMPVLDGLKTVGIIRENESNKQLPRQKIIAMTAHALSGDKAKFLQAGMDNYISKPIDATKLFELIEQ